MKFGAQLKSKSVPEWKAYNIDYNELKFKIRIATEGNNDKRLVKDLHKTLVDQIDTATLFLNSKAGEIKRRIIYTEKLLESLDEDEDQASDPLIYTVEQNLGKLSTDLQKLSRFLVVQKTAVRKLLKKYTKHSNDDGALNFEINKYMIETPDSFIYLDFTGLFLELALIYDLVRERQLLSGGGKTSNKTSPMKRRMSLTNDFDELNVNESFDFESMKSGNISEDYLVHYDNLAELKLFLLSNFFFIDKSVSSQRQKLQLTRKTSKLSIHEIIKNNNTKIAQEQPFKDKSDEENSNEESANDIYRRNSIYTNNTDKLSESNRTTKIILEDPKNFISIKTNSAPGSIITNLEDDNRSLLISAIGGFRKCSNALLKDDQFVKDLLISCTKNENYEQFYQRHSVMLNSLDSLEKISIEWLFPKHIKPFLKILFSESRFTNVKKTKKPTDDNTKAWITLTSNVSLSVKDLQSTDWTDNNEQNKDIFPYAHLRICYADHRTSLPDSIQKLRTSHLVYKIDNYFSIFTYHLFKSGQLTFAPSWANLFGDNAINIKKLPPKIKKVRPQPPKTSIYASSEAQDSDGTTLHKASISENSSSQFRYWNEFDNGSEGEQDTGFFIDVDSQEDQMVFSPNTIDKIYKITSSVSGYLHKHLPRIFDAVDTEPLLKDPTNQHSNRSHYNSFESSDIEPVFDHRESKYAHDKLLVFLSLSSSTLSLFLTAVSLGITSSLYRYDGIYIGAIVLAILLVAMLISLFFSMLGICLLMISEPNNRSPLQTFFVIGVFVFVTIMIIMGIVGIFGV